MNKKLLEFLVAVFAVIGLLTVIKWSPILGTVFFIAASFAMLVLFFLLGLGYLIVTAIIFLVYGVITYLF